MGPVYIMAALSIGGMILSAGIAWGVADSRAKSNTQSIEKIEKKYDSVLFASDGRLNLVPSISCSDLRTKCGADNAKEHKCLAGKVDKILATLEDGEKEKTKAREANHKFQLELVAHMQRVDYHIREMEKL